MAYQDCIDAITRAAGRPLTENELDELLTGLEDRKRARLAQGEDIETASRGAADDYAQEMATNAIIQKRNAALQLKTDLTRLDQIRSQFGANNVLGLEAVLVGVNSAVKGSRQSVANEQMLLAQSYKSDLQTRLRRDGVLEIYNTGAMDREVSKALFALNRKDPLPLDVPKEAIKIAESIATVQEKARIDGNNAGAYIRKLEGYITRQSHDQYNIHKYKYPQWKADILPKLDMARTFGSADPEKFLKAVWDGLASGVHMKSLDQSPGNVPKTRNIAKAASYERVLHFRDSDAWFDYNQKYGVGSLREAVEASLGWSAQNTGLMRIMGPNPQEGFNRTVKQLLDREKDADKRAALDRAAQPQGMLRNRMAEVTGETRAPVNAILASRSATWRAVLNMAKLGGMVFAQGGDVVAYGSEMRYQGRNMLSGMGESLKAIGTNLRKEERNELYRMLDVYFDDAMSVGSRYSDIGDRLPGTVAKAQQLFFKLNLARAWTDRQRTSAIVSMSHRLALNASKEFSEIGPDLQRALSLHGIGDRQWGIIRKAVGTADDGREYAAGELIEGLPDQLFVDYVTSLGQKVTPKRIATAKREVADQLRGFFLDRAAAAQVTPDARTRSIANQGTRPGTVMGEFDRMVLQFKSFGIAMIQKTLGREIYGRGAAVDATFLQALRSGNGEIFGVANLIVYTTIMGYVSLQLKQMIKGKEPRVPESTADVFKILAASMVQGGGFGLYGDFIFGEYNRFGGGIIGTAAGPTAGFVEDIWDLKSTFFNPDADERVRDTASKAFKTMLNNTPFANLFYTRVVLDYFIVYGMQEYLSPGYLRRMEKRTQRENNQEFLLRPSQHANQF